MNKHPAIRMLFALIIALAVTGGVLAMLASMNDRPVPEKSELPPVRTILLASELAPQPEEQPPEEEPEPIEPEPLVVDLDVPTPELPVIEPLDLPSFLPDPTIDTVHIHVSVQHTPKPQPRRPAPAPQPPAPAKPAAKPTGPLEADRVDHPPRELAGNAHPSYPTREHRRGIEGVVVVKILIDETGRVQDAQIISGREGFTDAVLRVVKNWRFTPANHEGRAVQVWGVKTVRFKLTD